MTCKPYMNWPQEIPKGYLILKVGNVRRRHTPLRYVHLQQVDLLINDSGILKKLACSPKYIEVGLRLKPRSKDKSYQRTGPPFDETERQQTGVSAFSNTTN